MNEKQIQAQINMLVQQRDNALNMCVNLSGELAVASETIADMAAQIEMLKAIVEAAKDTPAVAEPA